MAREPKTVPDCWECRKPCDSLARIGAVGGAKVYTFVAYCHGKQDRVEVPLELVHADGRPKIEFGFAFQPANLLTEEAPLVVPVLEGRR